MRIKKGNKDERPELSFNFYFSSFDLSSVSALLEFSLAWN